MHSFKIESSLLADKLLYCLQDNYSIFSDLHQLEMIAKIYMIQRNVSNGQAQASAKRILPG